MDQQAELRAPVAQMVVGNHAVAQRAVDAVERVADDRGTDVADVHGLGHVRAGVIDHHRPAAAEVRDAEVRRGGERRELFGEPGGGDGQVDEARPRHGGGREHGRQRQGAERGFGDLTRGLAQHLGQRHGVVTLEIAEPRVCRGLHAEGGPVLPRVPERGLKRLPQPLRQQLLALVHRLVHRLPLPLRLKNPKDTRVRVARHAQKNRAIASAARSEARPVPSRALASSYPARAAARAASSVR